MYDFYRAGLAQDSRTLLDPHPKDEIKKKHGTRFEAAIDGFAQYAVEKYGKETFNAERFKRMERVVIFVSLPYFMSTAFKPFYFKDLPVAGFEVCPPLNIQGFLESRSNNVVSVEKLDFKMLPAYEHLFSNDTTDIRKHNTCMFHDAFVDKLIGGFNRLIKQQNIDSDVIAPALKM